MLDGTYTGLTASIASWLKRSDLTAAIPDFVALCEARIARDLKLRRQWTGASIVFASNVQSMPLPADWLRFERVQVQNGRVLDLKTPRMLVERDATYTVVSGPSYPDAYGIEGSNIVLPPTSGGVTLDVAYRARIPSVIGSSGVQGLLQEHPGIYLWGSLAEAAPFLIEDERIAVWEGKYAADVQSAQSADTAAEYSGSTLRVRAR